MTVLSLDIEYQDGVDHDSRLHLLIQARLGYRNKGKYLIRLTFGIIFFKVPIYIRILLNILFGPFKI